MSAVVLGVAHTLIKPILSLVLLPITVITLGIAGLFINALMLLVTTILVPQFNVLPWNFELSTTIVHINLFWSYVITSFVLSGMIRLMHHIVHDDEH